MSGTQYGQMYVDTRPSHSYVVLLYEGGSTQFFVDKVFVCCKFPSLELRGADTFRHAPCAQSEVHEEMVCQRRSGRTRPVRPDLLTRTSVPDLANDLPAELALIPTTPLENLAESLPRRTEVIVTAKGGTKSGTCCSTSTYRCGDEVSINIWPSSVSQVEPRNSL